MKPWKNIVRKLFAFALVFVFVMSLTACSGNRDLPLKGQSDSKTEELKWDSKKHGIYEFADSVYATEGYDKVATITALSDFSLRLFEENMDLWGGEQCSNNILISPASIITALGMTTYGAKGVTLSQMEEVFGVERGYLNYYNNKYLEKVSDELKLANSIWFTNDERLTVNDAFLQFNEECYGSEIYETAFNDATLFAINDWVEKKTDGMIKNILDEIPQDAVMYLINALVFEAEWAEKYDESQIWKNAEFTTSTGEVQKVDMMRSEEFLYLEDKDAKGFIKQYKGGNYAFVALLPNEGITISEYVKNLSGEHLQNMLVNPYRDAMVFAHLPQFSYEYNVEMSELLKEMGMTDAFSAENADFTSMATSTRGNIFINRVLHKTYIEVSPVGTKAGAATVVEMTDESAPFHEEMKEVFLDRPFLYMIIDLENNMPVFIGVVNSVE